MQADLPPDPAVPNIVAEKAPAAAPSHAGAPEASAREPPSLAPSGPPRRRWYGWQTLLIDLADLPVWGASIRAKSEGLALVGLGMYLLGPPAVHLAHGHGEKALADLGVRVGLPLLVGTIGYALGDDPPPCPTEQWFCMRFSTRPLYAVVGALVGHVGAVAIDAAALAREDVGPEPSRVTKSRPFEWSPDIRSLRGGAMAGIRGNF